jgi:hypothetical protein
VTYQAIELRAIGEIRHIGNWNKLERPSFARLSPTCGGERENWDGPRRHALVFGVLRIPLGLIGVLRIAVCAAEFNGMYVEVLISDFDAGVGVGDEVPVPRGAQSTPAAEANSR